MVRGIAALSIQVDFHEQAPPATDFSSYQPATSVSRVDTPAQTESRQHLSSCLYRKMRLEFRSMSETTAATVPTFVLTPASVETLVRKNSRAAPHSGEDEIQRTRRWLLQTQVNLLMSRPECQCRRRLKHIQLELGRPAGKCLITDPAILTGAQNCAIVLRPSITG